MIYARQSTAIIVTVGPVLDADGVAVTGGVVGDFKIAKNGGAPAALNGSATLTHRHTGFYSLSLTTSDVATVGTAEITIDDTVNSCPMKEIQVVEEAIYDALFAASANGFAGAAGASTMTFSNTSIATAAAVTTVNGLAANVITAASMAADASAEIADAVWDEDATGHQTGGTFGQAIGDPGADTNTIFKAVVTDATGATVGVDVVAVKAETAAIVADTNELQTDWVNGGRLDLLLDATLADTNELQTDWVNGGRLDLILDARASQTSVDTIDGIVDSILVDTGTDGVVVAAASKTGYTLSAAGLADFFDTDTGTTYASAVAGSVVAEIADNAGGSALTAAAIADAVWDEAQADHVAAGSFGETATEIASILVDTAEIGAAGAGLTNINLPNQTMDIVGNITGNLSGSVGSVTGAVGSVTAAVTVDDSTPIDANVEQINTVPIVGDGSGTPFNV